MRRSPIGPDVVFVVAAALACGCAPAHKPVASAAAVKVPPPAAAAAAAVAPAPRCRYAVRRLSAAGRGAGHPQIAAAGDAFAVSWEEGAEPRSVHLQSFGGDAEPLGPSIVVADLPRGVGEPRVSAYPDAADGFALFWSVERADSSAIVMRHVDGVGKPRGDVVPVLVARGARALAAVATEGGFAIAWWTRGGAAHDLSISFVDPKGRALGRPLVVTHALASAPTVALGPGAATVAWEERVADAPHVFVGDLAHERLERRVDLGAGARPQLGAGVVLWERREDHAIVSALIGSGGGGGEPLRVVDGRLPAAAPLSARSSALCYAGSDLVCATLALGSELQLPTRIARAPRALGALDVAATPGHIGATWQTREGDDGVVWLAGLSCPDVGVATPRP